jgi:hypothetical protein
VRVLAVVDAGDAFVLLVALLWGIGALVVYAGWSENRADRQLDERIADRHRRRW